MMRSTQKRRRLLGAVALLAAVGLALGPGVVSNPASAATPVTVTVTSTPTPAGSLQAVAFSVTVTNTGSSAASGLTLSNSLSGVGVTGPYPIQLPNGPVVTSSLGSCSYASPTETCTAATLPAGGVWSVSITLGVTAAPGASYSDAVTVSGSEASSNFTASQTDAATASPTLPSGFSQTTLASGLQDPIALAWAANGDLYIGEQGGTVLVRHDGVISSTAVLSLNVFKHGETGLLGLALDPNFATNGYLYVSYTLPLTTSGRTVGYARLSRFTVVGGVASPSSEVVYYTGNQVQNEDGTGGSYDHAGNDVQVGPDGELWWSVGDNVPAISNGQNLANIYGKILRFNLDGTVPADNPFVNVSGAVPYIYAYGLRNPWRFSFLPAGQAITEDTGSSYWEDLDVIEPGENFGWPVKEGNCGSCGYANPVYSYGHYPVDAAASAITTYSGSVFPSSYDHVVFVGDYNRGDIEAITLDPNYKTPVSDTVFDSAVGAIADLQEGPDGNLYYVSIFQGTVSEITAPGPFPPSAVAGASPDAGVAPLTVQFSSAGSSDPYGKSLTCSWNFGDGSPVSTAANPSHTYTTDGTYTATLTVSNGAQTSTAATTRVVVDSEPPTASITAPSTYDAGSTIDFSGSATDPVDGALPAYDYTWQVDFHSNGVTEPSWYAEVARPFYGPVTGVTSGSFTVPTDPSQVPGSYYSITLTATDSVGVKTVVTKNVDPNLTTWKAGSSVSGTGYFLDGAWETGAITVSDVVGSVHVLTGMPLAQDVSGTSYRFEGWADGSALTDTVTAGSAPGSVTATYDQVQATMPSPWQSADIGSPIAAGSAGYAPGDQSFYADGAGADVYGANEQMHYIWQPLTGNGTIVARVRYQTNSSAWAKAGVMVAPSASAGTPFVDALVTPDVSPNSPNINGVGCDANGCLAPLPPVAPTTGYGVRMQYSGTGSITPSTIPSGFVDPDKWLKLQRVGNSFTSWESSNGVNWTQIGTVTMAMPTTATVGLFVTSHNIGEDSTVAFDNVTVTQVPPPGPLPSPWVDTDVGAPSPAGSGGYANGVFTVQGSGADVWGTNDQFNYVEQPLAGNGTIVARVTSQSVTGSSNAKAGIMVKQSTTAGTPYFNIFTGPAGVVKSEYDFTGSVGGGTLSFPNIWLKITRVGSTFTSYESSDGVTWTQVAKKTLSIATPAVVGLFECSHKAGLLGSATFDDVSVTAG